MTTLDAQREQWAEAFNDVEQDVLTLFHTRQVWRVLSAVFLDGGTQNRAQVMDYLNRTYVATICSAVRRQLDTDPKSNSLVRSLQRVIDTPRLMDREHFVKLHHAAHGDDFDPEVAFNAYAEPGQDVVSARHIAESLEKLRADAEPVAKFADRTIAHRDRRSADLLYAQIDRALDALEVAVKKYWVWRIPGYNFTRQLPSSNSAS